MGLIHDGCITFMPEMKDLLIFTKHRLSLTVVISALLGYFFMTPEWSINVLYLFLGGYLVTGASNGTNQIIEKDLDLLMKRTEKRPLAAGRFSIQKGWTLVFIMLLTGSFLLYLIHINVALLGILSYISYSFAYTPLKTKTSWAVLVGAFPGALPPFIGAVAGANGAFGFEQGVLFFIQFMWQFPHFWAIAWVAKDDYEKAGIRLLPMRNQKDKVNAILIAVYTIVTVMISFIPWYMGWITDWGLVVCAIAGLAFYMLAHRLTYELTDKAAKRVMFASFIYLPVVQLCYVIFRIYEPS